MMRRLCLVAAAVLATAGYGVQAVKYRSEQNSLSLGQDVQHLINNNNNNQVVALAEQPSSDSVIDFRLIEEVRLEFGNLFQGNNLTVLSWKSLPALTPKQLEPLLHPSLDLGFVDAELLEEIQLRASQWNETKASNMVESLKQALASHFGDAASVAELELWESNSTQALLDKLFPNMKVQSPKQYLFRKLYGALMIKLMVLKNAIAGAPAVAAKPKASWGINHLTFFTSSELQGTSCGTVKFIGDLIPNGTVILPGNGTDYGLPSILLQEQGTYPDSFNLGADTGPVLNQQSCGDCYAFSAAQVLTGAYAAANPGQSDYYPMSVQQITSCSQRFGNMGCNGGTFQNSWNYAQSVNGLTTSTVYPFVSGKGGNPPACDTTLTSQGVLVPSTSKYVYVSVTTDSQMQAAAFVQPVSIAINASQPCFKNYKSGILSPSNCVPGSGVDHAVVLTGWGQDSAGNQYWIVKNSWGSSWGNQGYVWIARLPESQNYFGMYTQSAYPKSTALSSQCSASNPPSVCVASTLPPSPSGSAGSTASPTTSGGVSIFQQASLFSLSVALAAVAKLSVA